MDSLVHQFAERRIDHSLTLDTVLACESGALDEKTEMALAGRVISAVAAMLFAIVDEVDAGRAKR